MKSVEQWPQGAQEQTVCPRVDYRVSRDLCEGGEWREWLAHYLYEMARGLDRQLVAWPDRYQAVMQAKHNYCLHLAERLLNL